MAKRSQNGKVIPIRPDVDQLSRVGLIEIELTTTWEEIARDALLEAEEKRRARRPLRAIRPPEDDPP